MSKYDDKTFQSYTEKSEQRLPKTQGGDIREFQDEFRNMSTSEVKKMMYLNKDENFSFDFFNNKQEFITEDYLNNLKKFDNRMSPEEKMNYFLDFMKEAYGVMTPPLLKKCFESSFNIWDSSLTLQDYEEMIQENFGKKQIDLNNPEDREKFKAALFNGESIAMKNDQLLQERKREEEAEQRAKEEPNLLFPSAIKEPIKAKEEAIAQKQPTTNISLNPRRMEEA